MTISFHLPGDLNQAAKEAALVELYRQKKLTHHELSVVLGISRFETDTLLKKHGVNYEVSVEEVFQEADSIRRTA